MKGTDVLLAMAGLTTGNFIYAALGSQDWLRALDHSYWEFGGVFAVFLMGRMKGGR